MNDLPDLLKGLDLKKLDVLWHQEFLEGLARQNRLEPEDCGCRSRIAWDPFEAGDLVPLVRCRSCDGSGLKMDTWDPSGIITEDTWVYAAHHVDQHDFPAVAARQVQMTLLEVKFTVTVNLQAYPEGVDRFIARSMADVLRNASVRQKLDVYHRIKSEKHCTFTFFTTMDPAAQNDVSSNYIVLGLVQAIPALTHTTALCPANADCYTKPQLLTHLIPHLNDNMHRWSREQIADWLDTLDADLRFTDPQEGAAA